MAAKKTVKERLLAGIAIDDATGCARSYGVSYGAVKGIVHRTHWRHVA